MDISSYLLTAIRHKKITQRAFAELIEVTPAYLNKLCKGTKTPSIDMLDKICAALDMTPGEFFSTATDPLVLSAEEQTLIRDMRSLPEYERKAVSSLVQNLSHQQD